MKHLIVFFTSLLLLSACAPQQTSEQAAAVSVPDTIQAVAAAAPDLVPAQQLTIINEKGGEVKTARGMKVTVPASAFTTKEGQAVKGTVTIRVKEYRNAADILFSGIDMRYHGKGAPVQMESDGMFDITAFSGTDELILKKNKALDIELPALSVKTDYKLFYMDPVSKKWVIRQDTLAAKAAKPALTAGDVMTIEWKESEGLKRVVNGKQIFILALSDHASYGFDRLPQQTTEKLNLYSLDMLLPNVLPDISSYPELTMYKNIRWMISDDNELAKFRPFQKHDSIVSSVIEKRNGVFNAFLITLKGKKYTQQVEMTATCLYEDRDENAERYNALMEERPVNEKRIEELKAVKKINEQREKLVRSFSVAKMGLYNCDRLYLMKSPCKVHIELLSFNDNTPASPMQLYVVSKKINSVWSFSSMDITVDTNSEHILFFLTNKGKVGYVEAAQMKVLKDRPAMQRLLYKELKTEHTDMETIRSLIEQAE